MQFQRSQIIWAMIYARGICSRVILVLFLFCEELTLFPGCGDAWFVFNKVTWTLLAVWLAALYFSVELFSHGPSDWCERAAQAQITRKPSSCEDGIFSRDPCLAQMNPTESKSLNGLSTKCHPVVIYGFRWWPKTKLFTLYSNNHLDELANFGSSVINTHYFWALPAVGHYILTPISHFTVNISGNWSMHAGNENVCFPPFISLIFLTWQGFRMWVLWVMFPARRGEKTPVLQNVRATVESWIISAGH